MTQATSYNYICLNRLAVYANGKTVYDEKFHEGVNIIRGNNSHGKSTIIDFIFYVMGGENITWKKEALLCDYVLAEIDVNSRIWTLRRHVTEKRLEGIDIFEGTMSDAEVNLQGWVHYASSRTSNRESYSQMLFSFLGIPNIEDNGNRLTIHKVLRALYLDQITPQDTFLYNDSWDSGTIRQMIGDVLVGVYSDELFAAKDNERKIEQNLELMGREGKNFINHLKSSGLETERNTLSMKLEDVEHKIASGLSTDEHIESFDAKLSNLNAALVNTEKEIRARQDANIDSVLFIEALERKVKFIGQSEESNKLLSDVLLQSCPICDVNIDGNIKDNMCPLCKNDLGKKESWNVNIRMRQELLFQIKESKQLVEKRVAEIEELVHGKNKIEDEIGYITQIIKSNKAILASIANNIPIESIYETVELLSVKEKLKQNMVILDTLDKIRANISKLTSELLNVKRTIERIEGEQRLQKDRVARSIDRFARRIVDTDILHKREFDGLSPIVIDFYNNTFLAGERNNFSASSQAYLKNSVHFALFFSATRYSEMLYPRFILCDNTEDKGLVAERSQVFQREIVKLSAETSSKHQIILTTSMIAPELNTSAYCVGEELVGDKYSLNFNN